MTARTTPTRPGAPPGLREAPAGIGTPSPTSDVVRVPAAVTAPSRASVTAPARSTPPPAVPPRPGERRAQRAARRRRRRLAVGCALLVAFCLAVTILIVVMAGNRTPGSQVVTPLGVAAVAAGSPLPSVRAGTPAWGRA